MAENSFDLAYVANLARLSLTEQEQTLFEGQLASIVGYVQKIGELDVTGIEPTLHGQPVHNIFRKDTPLPSLDRETVLANAPQRVGNEFRMPKIVE